jgi:hypothetical protein
MSLIRPFAALRPAPGRAPEVIAPPYDVLNTAEARVMAAGRPWSFLHISKPEIDLPPDTDPYAPEVYAKAAENLQKMIAAGVLQQDAQASYYAYRLIMGEHVQVGLVAAASVADYDTNRIRKHEFTRPDKEDDRVRQIEALERADRPGVAGLSESSRSRCDSRRRNPAEPMPIPMALPNRACAIPCGRSAMPPRLARLTELFDAMPALYIADGHHRSASASRICAARRAANAKHRRRSLQLLPVGDLSASPDAHLRLQPRHQGHERFVRAGIHGARGGKFHD